MRKCLFAQFINFSDELLNSIMPYFMVLADFAYFKQFSKNIYILNTKVHASISQRRMDMSGISCKVHISDWHFLNGAVVDDKLRPPIFTEYFKLGLRDRFEILGGVTHDPHIVLSNRNNHQKVLAVDYSISKRLRRPLNLCITEVNVRV